jgi:hypothetical protein
MTGWSLDLGTTNSGVAQWDPNRSQPQLVELPGVCRSPDGEDPLEARAWCHRPSTSWTTRG